MSPPIIGIAADASLNAEDWTGDFVFRTPSAVGPNGAKAEAQAEQRRKAADCDSETEDWDKELGLQAPLGTGAAQAYPASYAVALSAEQRARGDYSDIVELLREEDARAFEPGPLGNPEFSGSDDWDREMFGAAEAYGNSRASIAHGFRLLLKDSAASTETDSKASSGNCKESNFATASLVTPESCRLAGELLRGNHGLSFEIIRYPPACHLYSFHAGEGRGRSLHGRRMVEWLQQLVSSKVARLKEAAEARTSSEPLLEDASKRERGLSAATAKALLDCAFTRWWANEWIECLNVLKLYFQLLRKGRRGSGPGMVRATDPAMMAVEDTAGKSAWASTPAVASSESNPPWDSTEADASCLPRYTLVMLELAALLPQPHTPVWVAAARRHRDVAANDGASRQSEGSSKGRGAENRHGFLFGDIVRTACSAFPAFREAFALVELRAAAHHLTALMEAADVEDSEYLWVMQGASLRSQYVPVAKMPRFICACYIRLYSRAAKALHGVCKGSGSSGGMTAARASSLMPALQPKNDGVCATGGCVDRAAGDGRAIPLTGFMEGLVSEQSPVYIQAAALTDLCMYLVGISPLTLEDAQEILDYLPDDEKDWEEDSLEAAVDGSADSDPSADSHADSDGSSDEGTGEQSVSAQWDSAARERTAAGAAAAALVLKGNPVQAAAWDRVAEPTQPLANTGVDAPSESCATSAASPPPAVAKSSFARSSTTPHSRWPAASLPEGVLGEATKDKRELLAAPGQSPREVKSPSKVANLSSPQLSVVTSPAQVTTLGLVANETVRSHHPLSHSPTTTKDLGARHGAPSKGVIGSNETAAVDLASALTTTGKTKGNSFLTGFGSVASAIEQRVMGMVRVGSLPAVPTPASGGMATCITFGTSSQLGPRGPAASGVSDRYKDPRGGKGDADSGSVQEHPGEGAVCDLQAGVLRNGAAMSAKTAPGGGVGVVMEKVPLLGDALGAGIEPEDIDPRFLVRNLKEPEDAGAYLEVLLSVYSLLPAPCLQGARTAFAAGLLASAAKRHEVAESLQLESVMVLDRALGDAAFPAPLLSPFGVHSLERLGDALLKNGKYEYGILALERAVDCFWELHHRAAEHDKLIRKVTRITLEHEDMRRAIEYHVRMLRRARKGGNVNEFVYLAKEIGRMLAEQGAFLDAEQYLRVASRLVSGTPMSKVVIRERQPGTSSTATFAVSGSAAAVAGKGKQDNGVNNVSSGAAGEVPFKGASSKGAPLKGGACTPGMEQPLAALNTSTLTASGILGPLAADGRPCMVPSVEVEDIARNTWASVTNFHAVAAQESSGSAGPDRSTSTPSGSAFSGAVIETQQYELQMKLVDVFTASLQHEKALKTLNSLLRRRIPAQQRSLVLLRVAECYLKLRRLASCDAALDRVILEADEVGEQGGGNASNPGSAATAGYSSQGGSGGPADWRHTLNGLGILPDGTAPCAVGNPPMPATVLLAGSGPGVTSGGPLEGSTGAKSATSGGGASGSAPVRTQASVGNAGAGGAGGMSGTSGALWSVHFLVLRAKCRLAAGDATTALHWVAAAMTVCVEARQTNPLGKLCYLRGRCLQSMALRLHNDAHGDMRPAGGPKMTNGDDGTGSPLAESSSSVSPDHRMRQQASFADSADGPGPLSAGLEVQASGPSEAECAVAAEDAFSTAHAYYRAADDVHYQAKCLTRIVELQLSRIFTDVVVRGLSVEEAASGRGAGILRAAEQRAASSLELAGEVAAPLLLVLSLVNVSELHWLSGRIPQAYSTWKEAHGILCLTFLQRQNAAEYYSDKQAPVLPLASLGALTQHKRQRSSGGSALAGASVKFGGSGGSGSGVSNTSPARSGGASNPLPQTVYNGGVSGQAACGWSDKVGGFAPAATPLRTPALPTIAHSPSVTLKLYHLLQRVVTMSFVLGGPPPLHCTSCQLGPLSAAALRSSVHLIAGWMALDGQTSLQATPSKGAQRRRHRRGRRLSNLRAEGGAESGRAGSQFDAVTHLPAPASTTSLSTAASGATATSVCSEGRVAIPTYAAKNAALVHKASATPTRAARLPDDLRPHVGGDRRANSSSTHACNAPNPGCGGGFSTADNASRTIEPGSLCLKDAAAGAGTPHFEALSGLKIFHANVNNGATDTSVSESARGTSDMAVGVLTAAPCSRQDHFDGSAESRRGDGLEATARLQEQSSGGGQRGGPVALQPPNGNQVRFHRATSHRSEGTWTGNAALCPKASDLSRVANGYTSDDRVRPSSPSALPDDTASIRSDLSVIRLKGSGDNLQRPRRVSNVDASSRHEARGKARRKRSGDSSSSLAKRAAEIWTGAFREKEDGRRCRSSSSGSSSGSGSSRLDRGSGRQSSTVQPSKLAHRGSSNIVQSETAKAAKGAPIPYLNNQHPSVPSDRGKYSGLQSALTGVTVESRGRANQQSGTVDSASSLDAGRGPLKGPPKRQGPTHDTAPAGTSASPRLMAGHNTEDRLLGEPLLRLSASRAPVEELPPAALPQDKTLRAPEPLRDQDYAAEPGSGSEGASVKKLELKEEERGRLPVRDGGTDEFDHGSSHSSGRQMPTHQETLKAAEQPNKGAASRPSTETKVNNAGPGPALHQSLKHGTAAGVGSAVSIGRRQGERATSISASTTASSGGNGGLEPGMSTAQRELWTCFCYLRLVRQKYSSGKLNLRDLRAQNVEIMQRIVDLGRQLNRPISRADPAGQGFPGGRDALSSTSFGAPLSGGADLSLEHRRGFSVATKSHCGVSAPHHQPDVDPSNAFPPIFGPLPESKQARVLRQPPRSAGADVSVGGAASEVTPERRGSESGESIDSSVETHHTSALNGAAKVVRLGRRATSPPLGMQRRSFSTMNAAARASATASLPSGVTAAAAAFPAAAGVVSVAMEPLRPSARAHRPRLLYPSTFHFVLCMGPCCYYYCPATGERMALSSDGSRPLRLKGEATRSTAEARAPSRYTRASWHAQTGPATATNDKCVAVSFQDETKWDANSPLIPRPDEHCLECDDAVTVVMERLPPQFALFLVTALLLEQPVLLIAAPGSEETLMYVAAGLLRLIRPFRWQHLHLPLCHQSAAHLLRAAIVSQEPFLIGTHPRVLESVCPASAANAGEASNGAISVDPMSGSNSGDVLTSFIQRITSFTETAHLTIVDLDSGIIHPAKALERAAAATMGSVFAPDADAALRPSPTFVASKGERRGGTGTDLGALGSQVQLPPLPARYRYQMGQRLEASLASASVGLGKRRQSTQERPLHPFVNALPREPEKLRFGAAKPDSKGESRTHRARRHAAHGQLGQSDVSESAQNVHVAKHAVAETTRGASSALGALSDTKTIVPEQALLPSDSAFAARCGDTLRHDMFMVMVSILKGYQLFLRPAGASMAGGIGLDRDAFCRFAKDDVRPFLRALSETRAFEAFVKGSQRQGQRPNLRSGGGEVFGKGAGTDARVGGLSSSSLQVEGETDRREVSGAPNASPLAPAAQPVTAGVDCTGEAAAVHSRPRDAGPAESIANQLGSVPLKTRRLATKPPSGPHSENSRPQSTSSGPHTVTMETGLSGGFREKFETAVRTRMQEKLRLYSTVATERMGAFLMTYFAPLPQAQPPQAMSAGSTAVDGDGWSTTAKAPKVKRRWCVLDATRLTYYRSRNRRRVKGHVPMDPRTVTLVTPPYTATTSQSTSEHHAIALLCAHMPPEIGMLVVRAETVQAHERWLRALKARLMPKELYATMKLMFAT